MAITIPLESEPHIVYKLLQNIKYEEYLALSEFVDNSVQSFLDNKSKLKALGQEAVQVIIETNKEFISIRDNAGGISKKKFDYAFRLSKPEALKDENSLHEFGVGMKIAALWFGSRFEVVTSCLGEKKKYTIVIDLDEIEKEKLSSVKNVVEESEKADRHYTEIKISKLKQRVTGNQIPEYQSHLSDVYRMFLEEGDLILKSVTANSDKLLKATKHKVLNEKFWANTRSVYIPKNAKTEKDVPSFKWEKKINFEMPHPIKFVRGRAFLAENFQRRDSGITIFRRKRGIKGTGKDTRYRPTKIFTNSKNEALYATLFVQVEVGPSTPVSSSKQISWDADLEDLFLEKLNECIVGDPKLFRNLLEEGTNPKDSEIKQALPLRTMGIGFRRQKIINLSDEIKKKNAKQATNYNSEQLKKSEEKANDLFDEKIDLKKTSVILDPNSKVLDEETIEMSFGNTKWEVTLRVDDEKDSDWFTYAEDMKKQKLAVSVSMGHPFTQKFLDKEGKIITSFLRVAAGLSLAEVVCNKTNRKHPDLIRKYLNEFLKEDLS